jgi:hypothetical protein
MMRVANPGTRLLKTAGTRSPLSLGRGPGVEVEVVPTVLTYFPFIILIVILILISASSGLGGESMIKIRIRIKRAEWKDARPHLNPLPRERRRVFTLWIRFRRRGKSSSEIDGPRGRMTTQIQGGSRIWSLRAPP